MCGQDAGHLVDEDRLEKVCQEHAVLLITSSSLPSKAHSDSHTLSLSQPSSFSGSLFLAFFFPLCFSLSSLFFLCHCLDPVLSFFLAFAYLLSLFDCQSYIIISSFPESFL